MKNTQELAFCNVSASLDPKIHLPQNGLALRFQVFLFFDSSWILDREFVNIVKALVSTENAQMGCLVNLDKTHSLVAEDAATIWLDGHLSGQQYEEKLEGNGPGSGWLYEMGRYACASDVGKWCIYCETRNDVALIAFEDTENAEKCRDVLDALHARPLVEAIGPDPGGLFPYNQLEKSWRETMLRAFR